VRRRDSSNRDVTQTDVHSPCRAHQIFLRAVQLAMTLAPKQPKGSWYTEAVAAVQKYRDDLWAAEQRGWTERRKPIVEKLKDSIDRLEEKQKNAANKRSEAEYWEFAMWLWKEWPPKTEGQCMSFIQSRPGAPPSAYVWQIAGPKDLPSLELSPRKRILKVMQVCNSLCNHCQ
jgi:hypothetical protein